MARWVACNGVPPPLSFFIPFSRCFTLYRENISSGSSPPTHKPTHEAGCRDGSAVERPGLYVSAHPPHHLWASEPNLLLSFSPGKSNVAPVASRRMTPETWRPRAASQSWHTKCLAIVRFFTRCNPSPCVGTCLCSDRAPSSSGCCRLGMRLPPSWRSYCFSCGLPCREIGRVHV